MQRFSTAIVVVAGLLISSLAPGVLMGQELSQGADRLEPKTQIELSFSGFSKESETGPATGEKQLITQEQKTLGAKLGISMKYLFLSAGLEQTEFMAQASSISDASKVKTQDTSATLILFDIIRPYIGRHLYERKNLLTDNTIQVDFLSEDRVVNDFIGLTVLFPISNTLSPFLGYARGRESMEILTEVTEIPLIQENYESYSNFFEAGLITGEDAGFNFLLVAKRKETPLVTGQLYDLEKSISESREVRFGYGFGEDGGVSVGYYRSSRGREFIGLSAFEETEESVTFVFQINNDWQLRLKQTEIHRSAEFQLIDPPEVSDIAFTQNALSIAIQF